MNPLLEFKFSRNGLTNESDGSLQMTWQIPTDLPYFTGHFPKNPIFPAVGIIDASLEIIRLSMAPQTLFLKEVYGGKIFRPITPLMTVQITLIPREKGRWKIQWKNSDVLLVDLDLRLEGGQISD